MCIREKQSITLKQIPHEKDNETGWIQEMEYNQTLLKLTALQQLYQTFRQSHSKQNSSIITQSINHHTLLNQLIKKKLSSNILENNSELQCTNVSIDGLKKQSSNEQRLSKKTLNIKNNLIGLSIQNQRLKLQEKILSQKIKCERLLKFKVQIYDQKFMQSKRNLIRQKNILSQQIKINNELKQLKEDYDDELNQFSKYKNQNKQKMNNISIILQQSKSQNQLIDKIRQLINENV